MKDGATSIRLADIADINPPLPRKPAANDTVSFLGMAALDAESGTTKRGEDRPYHEVMKGYTPFLANDVLVAKITPCFENGKIAQAVIDRPIGFGSTEFHVVRPKAGKADPRFLLHALRQPAVLVDGERRMTGSAGQKRVPENYFANLSLPNLDLGEQRRIADILDRADALRAKRRAAIAKLDELTQAIFIDMFGDPTSNGGSVPNKRLEDISLRVTDGTHLTPVFRESGVPFIFVKNIKNGHIDFQTDKYISESERAELYCRCPIESGDVLYTTVGATYGQAAPVGDFTKFAFQRHLAHIKPNRSQVIPRFLANVMQLPFVKRQADKWARGAAQPTINLKELREFIIPVPSLGRQAEYVSRVEQLDRTLAPHLASLTAINDLFSSLQDRAFRGAL